MEQTTTTLPEFMAEAARAAAAPVFRMMEGVASVDVRVSGLVEPVRVHADGRVEVTR